MRTTGCKLLVMAVVKVTIARTTLESPSATCSKVGAFAKQEAAPQNQTLDCFLFWKQSAENLPPYLEQLQQEIEDKLPGMYTFFDKDSLHVTFRAIIS